MAPIQGYRCVRGGGFVPIEKIGDGMVDCVGGSDEGELVAKKGAAAMKETTVLNDTSVVEEEEDIAGTMAAITKTNEDVGIVTDADDAVYDVVTNKERAGKTGGTLTMVTAAIKRGVEAAATSIKAGGGGDASAVNNCLNLDKGDIPSLVVLGVIIMKKLADEGRHLKRRGNVSVPRHLFNRLKQFFWLDDDMDVEKKKKTKGGDGDKSVIEIPLD